MKVSPSLGIDRAAFGRAAPAATTRDQAEAGNQRHQQHQPRDPQLDKRGAAEVESASACASGL
jgi:hypothetical protein